MEIVIKTFFNAATPVFEWLHQKYNWENLKPATDSEK